MHVHKLQSSPFSYMTMITMVVAALGGVVLSLSLQGGFAASLLGALGLAIYVTLVDCTGQSNRQECFLYNAIFWGMYIAGGLMPIWNALVLADMTPLAASVAWLIIFALQVCWHLPIVIVSWCLRFWPKMLRLTVIALLWSAVVWACQLWDYFYPFLNIGYGQIDGPLASLFQIGGVSLVGFSAIVLVSAFVCLLWPQHRRDRQASIFILFIGLFGCLGATLKTWTVERHEQPLRASAIQTNAPISRYHIHQARQTIQTLKQLLPLVATNTDVVLMPEGTFGMFFDQIPDDYFDLLAKWSSKHSADVVMGTFSEVQANPKSLNDESASKFSAVLLPSNMLRQSRSTIDSYQPYDKRMLIPVAEKMPDALAWIPKSFDKFSFSNGVRGTKQTFYWKIQGIRLAPSLCYEILFGDSIRQTAQNADVLIHLSMSRWFDGTGGIDQLHQIARARAMEAGRSLIRVDHFGWTELISPAGQVLSQFPLGQEGVMNIQAPVYVGLTPYYRWGSRAWWFIAMVVLGCVALLCAWPSRRRSDFR